jgi:hypothetical protein
MHRPHGRLETAASDGLPQAAHDELDDWIRVGWKLSVERPTSIRKVKFERSRNESSGLEGNFGSHFLVLAVFAVRDAVEGLGPSRLHVSGVALHAAKNFTG